ncbi:MAG: molybdopterin molybdotransferase MoeA [Candidatus Cyclobacteriaceae bacterium M2_1C_046]
MAAEKLISVDEALHLVLKEQIKKRTETVELKRCMGKILAEDISADRDFPPFDRVMMDGIAIQYKKYEEGVRKFPVSALQPAGAEQAILEDNNTCIEVMTGSLLPKNTDTVIPYEKIKIENGVAIISGEGVEKGKNIHQKGNDRKKDEKLIIKDTKISAAEVGILATVGKSEVKVYQSPSIAVISTGDELVDVNQEPELHQIRKSNSWSLYGALVKEGLDADLFHLKDDRNEIKEKLKNILNNYQVLLLTGGVSKGKKDLIPEVLNELKVKTKFHRVAQRPGKPLFFGKRSEAVVFGFPGNPVSTFICFYKYFLKWYRSSYNLRALSSYAVLSEDIEFKPELTYFVQVKLSEGDEGRLMATPVPGHGSGDLANLLYADGFIELPGDKSSFNKGSVYPLINFRF